MYDTSDIKLTTMEKLEMHHLTAQSDVPSHEFLYQWHGKPCFARGELVALTGKAKSGKTYVNSILMALAERKEPLLGLSRIGKDTPAYRVLWVDTEQSPDSTVEILRDRVGALIGHEPDPEQFHVYNLRRVNWQERLSLVHAAIVMTGPDIVLFDGIRDVVGDINNYEEAQKVIDRLLSVASYSHACIVCVLHQNKAIEDKTLRGALGTELQNKSFETYECTKDITTGTFTITQTATRKYDLPGKIYFKLNAQGLPEEMTAPKSATVPTSQPSERTPEAESLGEMNTQYLRAEDKKVDKAKLFRDAIVGDSVGYDQLKTRVMELLHISSYRFANTLISEAMNERIIHFTRVNNQLAYHYGPMTVRTLFDPQ